MILNLSLPCIVGSVLADSRALPRRSIQAQLLSFCAPRKYQSGRKGGREVSFSTCTLSFQNRIFSSSLSLPSEGPRGGKINSSVETPATVHTHPNNVETCHWSHRFPHLVYDPSAPLPFFCLFVFYSTRRLRLVRSAFSSMFCCCCCCFSFECVCVCVCFGDRGKQDRSNLRSTMLVYQRA